MDLRTSELTIGSYKKVSPHQGDLNLENKRNILSHYFGNVKFYWAVPVALTFTELVYLKYGKRSLANRVSLYKWISYILATVVTNFSSAEALRKCEYFNRLYPHTPKIQREHIRDAEILKRTVNI